jgi:DNA-binding MarR family transcriptional regulator
MDAISTDAAEIGYSGPPPILLAASSDGAMARAEATAAASGLRVGARASIQNAHSRIQEQIATAAVWIEVDSDAGQVLDELLTRVSEDVCDGRYAAVVSATSALVDPVAARLYAEGVELIVDADDAQRASAFGMAIARHGARLSLSDVASDNNAERLRQLSEEVSRIASTLARLSTGPGASARPLEQMPSGDLPPLSADTVRGVIRARRLRSRYFREELFADPAWDMLLDLLQAEIAQLRVPVSSLCIAAAVPATTALRWLKTMVSQGIFVRRADPHDGRRVFVELAPEASQAMRRYFAEVGQAAVI